MSLTAKEYSYAYERGKAHRRGCGNIGGLPYRGKTERIRLLAEAWSRGFADQNEEMKRRVEAQA